MKQKNTVEPIKIVMTGGGTGGHVYPAIAIARELEKQIFPIRIIFMGTKERIESKIVPREGYELKTISVSFLPRKINLKSFTFFPILFKGIVQSLFFLRKFRPDIVVGTGGFVCGPVIMAAHLLKISCLVVEENSYPGVTTKVLAKIVNEIHLTFEDTRKYFKSDIQEKIFVSGNPVREIKPISKEDALEKWGLSAENKTILVFGGSQGAHGINMAMMDALKYLPQNINIIFQTGEADFNYIEKECQEYPQVTVKPFIYDMNSAYQLTDLVICRAGASTISELTMFALPAIFIPFPAAAENHQEYNARSVVEPGGAKMILEKDLTGETLADAISGLFADESQIKKMSQKMQNLQKPHAAKNIVAHILKIIQKTKGEV